MITACWSDLFFGLGHKLLQLPPHFLVRHFAYASEYWLPGSEDYDLETATSDFFKCLEAGNLRPIILAFKRFNAECDGGADLATVDEAGLANPPEWLTKEWLINDFENRI